jgi:predicted RNase H-related nuclease YkuK (DUF458 family)
MSMLKFSDLLKENWRNIEREDCNLVEELKLFLASESASTVVHIGTDAQKTGKRDKCNYVVCVIVHDPFGRGCRVFYLKFRNINTNNLWEKLYNETMLSLQVAVELSEVMESIRERILVHVDANPNPKYKSSCHVKALAGMVMGFGFKHVLKPDSWCSSHAADHIVKNKNERNTKH